MSCILSKDIPSKTIKAYKLFMIKDDKLYPPMVANPDGSDTPTNVWLDAVSGIAAPDSKTGRRRVCSGGKGTHSGKGTLAYRPGWHSSEVPYAPQFFVRDENGKKTLMPKDFVWAECEISADIDYQEEAMSYGYTKSGKFRHAYAGLPRVPENGYYTYRTNPNPKTAPWFISGKMKVLRILPEEEVNNILIKNKITPPLKAE